MDIAFSYAQFWHSSFTNAVFMTPRDAGGRGGRGPVPRLDRAGGCRDLSRALRFEEECGAFWEEQAASAAGA